MATMIARNEGEWTPPYREIVVIRGGKGAVGSSGSCPAFEQTHTPPLTSLAFGKTNKSKDVEFEANPAHPKVARASEPGKCFPQADSMLRYEVQLD